MTGRRCVAPIAVLLSLLAGCGSGASDVVLEVEASSGKIEITATNPTGGQDQIKPDSPASPGAGRPWRNEFRADSGTRLYLSAVGTIGGQASVAVKCRIYVDGDIVAEQSSTGEGASVVCNHGQR